MQCSCIFIADRRGFLILHKASQINNQVDTELLFLCILFGPRNELYPSQFLSPPWHENCVWRVVLFAQQSAASEKVDLTSKSKVDSESKAVKSQFSRNSPVASESKVISESKAVKSHFRVEIDFRLQFFSDICFGVGRTESQPTHPMIISLTLSHDTLLTTLSSRHITLNDIICRIQRQIHQL